MRRRLLNLLTALSLVLCAATLALCVRSSFVVDELMYTGGRSRYILTTADGGFDVTLQEDDLLQQSAQGLQWIRLTAPPGVRSLWRRSISSAQHPYTQQPWRPPRLGFWWGTLNQPDPYRPAPVLSLVIIGPVWPIALPCAALPVLWAVRRYRWLAGERRRGRGLCPR